ncbi:MAG: radical SAM family heme chaperone HemW [Firmicutes bacterium]|nr:radical SAM family heme chaperone HemW [Bacillota bacterium]
MAEEALLTNLERPSLERPSSLYIHVPFCRRKCLYCDFVSYPYGAAGELGYLAALEQEMALWAGKAAEERWTLSTVFIGGGTPTCLSADGLGEIITKAGKYFNLSPDVEFTVEANPGTVERAGLAMLRQLGVNRLSLGAQACDATTLRTLGRIHSHRQTVEAVEQARGAGFANLNLDLICGVPGQTLEQWLSCLAQIISLQPEHISAYGLQLEPGVPLYAMIEAGILRPCDEELQADMYYGAIDALQAAGYRHYEISNFARPGRECRHNLVYWHNGAYLGLGPAAHSRLGMERLANEASLEDYQASLAAGRLPTAWSETLRIRDDMFETVFLGLRMMAGLDLAGFQARFGVALDQVYPGVAARLTENKLLTSQANFLRLTRRGLAVANMVMSEFATVTNS